MITAANYRDNLIGFWALASLVGEAPLPEMIAAIEHADAIGPLVDPTAYRDKVAAMHEDLEMLRALLHVQTTLASIRRRRAGR